MTCSRQGTIMASAHTATTKASDTVVRLLFDEETGYNWDFSKLFGFVTNICNPEFETVYVSGTHPAPLLDIGTLQCLRDCPKRGKSKELVINMPDVVAPLEKDGERKMIQFLRQRGWNQVTSSPSGLTDEKYLIFKYCEEKAFVCILKRQLGEENTA